MTSFVVATAGCVVTLSIVCDPLYCYAGCWSCLFDFSFFIMYFVVLLPLQAESQNINTACIIYVFRIQLVSTGKKEKHLYASISSEGQISMQQNIVEQMKACAAVLEECTESGESRRLPFLQVQQLLNLRLKLLRNKLSRSSTPSAEVVLKPPTLRRAGKAELHRALHAYNKARDVGT